MKLPAGFGEIDFSDWARALMSAFISGGASAVTTGFVVAFNDPVHYKPGTGEFLELIGSVFVISGVLNGMNFLRQRPLPEFKTVVTTVQKTEAQAKPAAVIVTTVQETKHEPVLHTEKPADESSVPPPAR